MSVKKTNKIIMKNLLPLAFITFFTISIFFRFKENSIPLFNKYGLKQKKNYVFVIPIKELKENIKIAKNDEIKKELEKCLRNRMYYWYSLIAILFSIFFSLLLRIVCC